MNALAWVLRMGRSGRGRLGLAIVLGATASGAAIGLSATAAWLISRASQHPPVLHLMVAIVAVRAFGLGRGGLRYGERLAGHDASFRILGDLRVATVQRLERVLPLRSRSGQESLGTGELLERFVDDVDGLQDLWVRVLLPYAASALVGVATVALVTVLVPGAGAWLAVTLLAVTFVAPTVSTRAARGAGARLAPLRARYQTEVLDLLDGATELAVYGALPARLERLGELERQMIAAEARGAASAGLGAALATLAAGIATWTGLWLGAGAVEGGTLAGVSLAVVVLVPLAVHEVFSGLAPAGHQLPTLAAAATRVQEVFGQPPAVIEPSTPGRVPPGPLGLHISALHARWTDASAEVLTGVELDVEPGERLVVTGRSGSGKSTFAAVLLRLLDPVAGTVELVGDHTSVAIDQLDSDDVRGAVGWCAQDAYVFDSTIEQNLVLARPDATRTDVRDALRRARLDDWIDQLPDGLLTMVGEHGSRLSGGQRQRLALARVLLADRRIVVFDEPTEHLDDPTAAALASDILDATEGRTVIVMTHRPELFVGADRTVELLDGRCSQRDVPA